MIVRVGNRFGSFVSFRFFRNSASGQQENKNAAVQPSSRTAFESVVDGRLKVPRPCSNDDARTNIIHMHIAQPINVAVVGSRRTVTNDKRTVMVIVINDGNYRVV